VWRLILTGFAKERRSGERRPRRHGDTEAGKQRGKESKEVEEVGVDEEAGREGSRENPIHDALEPRGEWQNIPGWIVAIINSMEILARGKRKGTCTFGQNRDGD
jgi:hypothetical protein